MSSQFQELDYAVTPIGALSLRRRYEPCVEKDVYEVKLGDEFLMTSLFTVSEIALAQLGIATLDDGPHDIVVGGLGLGYTARAVLDHTSVRSMLVVDLLPEVLDWHKRGLLPLSLSIVQDERTRFVEGDFFALSNAASGFDSACAGRQFHAILLDIDHSPEALLDDRSRSFYKEEGLERLASHLLPGGTFALWSNCTPDHDFTRRLNSIFSEAWAEVIAFRNPLQSRQTAQTVYLARKAHSRPEEA